MTATEISIFMQLRRLLRLARLLGHFAAGLLLCRFVIARATTKLSTRTHLVQWWMRRLCRILNVHIEVCGQISDSRTLFVCNHISWLDIPALLAVIRADFVAKQEVRDCPVVGYLAATVGTRFLSRGDSRSTSETGTALAWWLMQDHNICIFPEGTSTDGSEVRRFHPRLFQCAISAHAIVQPVTINYPQGSRHHPAVPFIDDDDLLSHLWRLLGQRSVTAELVFHPPLVAADHSRDDLALQSRTQVTQGLHPAKSGKFADPSHSQQAAS